MARDNRFKVRDESHSNASEQTGSCILSRKWIEGLYIARKLNRGGSQKKKLFRWQQLYKKRGGKDLSQQNRTGFVHMQNRIRCMPQGRLLGFDLKKNGGAVGMGGKRFPIAILILIRMRVYAPFSIKVMGMVKKVHAGKEVDV
jgi:hypothetical protein